jgi:hypothetical protein
LRKVLFAKLLGFRKRAVAKGGDYEPSVAIGREVRRGDPTTANEADWRAIQLRFPRPVRERRRFYLSLLGRRVERVVRFRHGERLLVVDGRTQVVLWNDVDCGSC